jgi:predicted SAM-dependent methyltransferase
MNLNLGSNKKRIDGYLNVDALPLPEVDVIHDLTIAPWPFTTNSVDDILAQEFLEHISWHQTDIILAECYRILRPGGKLTIQVPDIGKMNEYYVANQICTCVPRKAARYEDYKADPSCFLCGGQAKIHPERWFVAYTGAQKHAYDAHLNIFTGQRLETALEMAGFENIQFKDNIYKLIVEAIK